MYGLSWVSMNLDASLSWKSSPIDAEIRRRVWCMCHYLKAGPALADWQLWRGFVHPWSVRVELCSVSSENLCMLRFQCLMLCRPYIIHELVSSQPKIRHLSLMLAHQHCDVMMPHNLDQTELQELANFQSKPLVHPTENSTLIVSAWEISSNTTLSSLPDYPNTMGQTPR